MPNFLPNKLDLFEVRFVSDETFKSRISRLKPQKGDVLYSREGGILGIAINGASEVMNIRVVTIGLINKSQVHPREVFADVIAERASAVIVAHNHPNGDLEPSSEDIAVTKRIKDAAAVLGISLLDHIIFNNKGYYSFVENNEL